MSSTLGQWTTPLGYLPRGTVHKSKESLAFLGHLPEFYIRTTSKSSGKSLTKPILNLKWSHLSSWMHHPEFLIGTTGNSTGMSMMWANFKPTMVLLVSIILSVISKHWPTPLAYRCRETILNPSRLERTFLSFMDIGSISG